MKKLLSFLILSLFLVECASSIKVYAKEKPPSVSADSAVLLDATTGQILYSKNQDSAYPPASTTKIMTALLVLENCKLDDYVTVGATPPKIEGTRIGLIQGEKIRVIDLLYGMLLASGNDCAEALAEYVGDGSIKKFADKMNKRARELGASHTNFVNPSGLFDENHKTSSKDLALIMKKLSENPEYSRIATKVSYTIPKTNKSKETRTVWNENKLIQKQSKYYYEGSLGGKTGYTIQSFHSYVTSASRGGHKFVVALVHDKKKTFFPDAVSLLNYGFNNFKLEKLYSKNQIVTTYKSGDLSVPLIAQSDFYYTKDIKDNSKPTIKLKHLNLAEKSFKKGETIEQATISLNGKVVGKLNLLSKTNHDPKINIKQHISQITGIDNQYILILSCFTILIGGTALLLIRRRLSNIN